jgi:iron complex outermembrane receptor protein
MRPSSLRPTKEAQSSTGQVNVMSLRNALEAIPGPDGTPYRSAATSTRREGCVPINVFGYNSITPEALKYVTAPGSLTTAITQKTGRRLHHRRTAIGSACR